VDESIKTRKTMIMESQAKPRKRPDRKKHNTKVRPEDLDWSKSSRELAAEHNVSLPYVWMYRRRLAPHTIPVPNSMRIDWTSVNWQQTTAQLVKDLRCANTTIQKMRAIHAPGTPDPEIIRQARRQKKEKKMKERWANIDWSLPCSEIVRQTGETRQTVYNYRRIYAPDTITRRSRGLPPDADLSLPPKEVAAKYKVGLVTVYRALQKRKNENQPT
jgi:DNA-binding CsgD family transcriptional regulator